MKTSYIRFILIVVLTFFLWPSSALRAEAVRRAYRGIIVVTSDSVVRAMEPYGGSLADGRNYADIVNIYHEEFPDVEIYCMVIPTAAGLYCPDTAKVWSRDEREVIQALHNNLQTDVHIVDILPILEQHSEENIYLRTDHHWAPLGAYYAAQEFARVAGVPFSDITHYDQHVVHNFVGTMARFSRDISVRNSPEDFIYYIPRDAVYETISTPYFLNKSRSAVLRTGETREVEFFRQYNDGSSAAYCTFMGGDTNTTQVHTSTNNGRRLMILKDSYGNALPGYLFSSFEEIFVVDCRYFTENIRKFVTGHQITDILFANNLIHASSKKTTLSYENYLVQ